MAATCSGKSETVFGCCGTFPDLPAHITCLVVMLAICCVVLCILGYINAACSSISSAWLASFKLTCHIASQDVSQTDMLMQSE